MGKVRIGTSGWSYDSWRGDFYPSDLRRGRELQYISRRLDTVEVNGSFYSLLRPETYESWYSEVQDGFVFAIKGSRFITHNKKLVDVETPLANFLASGVLALRERLGPIVWQLSDALRFEANRIEGFLGMLPHDLKEALRLARKHDHRVEGRSYLRVERNHRIRHAIEVRNESFFVPEFVRIARRTGTAIVFSDAADWPYIEEVTAGFVYVRLHGHTETYASGYSGKSLDAWSERLQTWHRGDQPTGAHTITDLNPPQRQERDVYVYFDNDQRGRAPHDACDLVDRIRGKGDR